MGVHFSIPVFLAATVLLASVVAVVNVAILIWELAAPSFSSWWQSPRMRLFRLGGATTLRQNLNSPCTLCQESLEAGEKVRTLSCNHVFHCGGTVKCKDGIDQWLLTGQGMSWQPCRQVPHPVLPWKRPPPSLTATSSPQNNRSRRRRRRRRRNRHA